MEGYAASVCLLPPNLLRYAAFPRSAAAWISSVPDRLKIYGVISAVPSVSSVHVELDDRLPSTAGRTDVTTKTVTTLSPLYLFFLYLYPRFYSWGIILFPDFIGVFRPDFIPRLDYITINEDQTPKVREHFKNTPPKAKGNMTKNHEFR